MPEDFRIKSLTLQIVGIFILNLLIKLPFCAEPSISNDEAFSIFFAQYPLSEIIEIIKGDTNPPFYFLILHFWVEIFGIDEFAVRSISVIFSSLAASVVFVIGRNYISREAGWISVILFTLSSANIYYAQEVRVFSLLLFLGSLSILAYLNLFYSEKKLVWAIVMFITTLMIMWSHYLVVFMFVIQFVFSWALIKRSRLGFYLYQGSQMLALICFIPWIMIVFENLIDNGIFWLKAPSLNMLFFETFKLAGSRLSLFFFLILLVTFLIRKLGNRLFDYEKLNPQIFYFLLAIWLIPILAQFLIGQFIPMFILRYFLYAGIGLFLSQAYMIAIVRVPKMKIALFSIALIGLLTSFNLAPSKEEDWKKTAQFIRQEKEEGTYVVLSAPYKARDFFYYYDREMFRDYKSFESKADEVIGRLGTAKDIQPGFEKHKKLMVIFAHQALVDPDNTLSKYLNKNYKYLNTEHFGNVKVHSYEKR